MPSLTSLVAAHGLVLLVDSASSCVQVGLLGRRAGGIWRESSREPGIAIFEGASAVMAEARVELSEIGALVFCEGPGSILGIRTAAAALRTWRCVAAHPATAFAYRSLQLVARDLADAGTQLPFAVVADARRGAWHMVEGSSEPAIGPVRRVPDADLAEYPGAMYVPAGFRAWSTPPRAPRTAAYALAELWTRQGRADLLRESDDPDAFLHQESIYATWTPAVHRAPQPRAF